MQAKAKAHGSHVSAMLHSILTAHQWICVCFHPSSIISLQQVLGQLNHCGAQIYFDTE